MSARFNLTADQTITSENETTIKFNNNYYANSNFTLNSDGTITWKGDAATLFINLSVYFFTGTINSQKELKIYRGTVQFGRNIFNPRANT